MAHGFLYLMAIIDLASRKLLAWRLSNTLTADFCVEALEEALKKFGAPEIFNTDQGSVHQRGVAHAAEGRRGCDQHGR
jgi:putative transposase